MLFISPIIFIIFLVILENPLIATFRFKTELMKIEGWTKEEHKKFPLERHKRVRIEKFVM